MPSSVSASRRAPGSSSSAFAARQLLEVAELDLQPAVVRADPAEHAYRVALGEAAVDAR